MSFSLIEVLIIQAASIVAVAVGFFFGWRAKRPDAKLIDRKFNPGPAEEPEGDIFTEALEPPKDDEKERGISTL